MKVNAAMNETPCEHSHLPGGFVVGQKQAKSERPENRSISMNRILTIASAAFLAGVLSVWYFFPWVWVEATMDSQGYTIEGCENDPPLLWKASVYDCKSNARVRYEAYISNLADDQSCTPDLNDEFHEFQACSQRSDCTLSANQRKALEADWRICKNGVTL